MMRFNNCCATALILLLLSNPAGGFAPPPNYAAVSFSCSRAKSQQQKQSYYYNGSSSSTRSSSSNSGTALSAVALANKKKHYSMLAGTVWPFLKKFEIGPAKAKAIVANIRAATTWQDLVILCFLAFCASPTAKYIHDLIYNEDDEDKEKEESQPQDTRKRTKAKKFVQKELGLFDRLGVPANLSRLAKIALSAYFVDIASIALTTLGFTFPDKWKISQVYTKFAYTCWAVTRIVKYKKMALCKFFRVDIEEMGRVEILDRVLNGVIAAISTILFLDWISVKMNIAVKGLLTFGGAGTLAFTLASQGLVTQLISGAFLLFSDKMFVGDVVSFGDGTSGKVMRQGWMETVLRQGDNSITRVPNQLLSSQKVSNLSRIRQSQVKQTLRFHYEDAEEIPALLEDIREEIKKACPRLITDNSRPFRVFWTNYNEDHLEVMVDTHHNIAPLGDAYWINRQNVLKAITEAINKHEGVELAQMYSFATSAGQPEWRVVPRIPKAPRRQDPDAALFEDRDGTVNGEANGVM